MIQGSYKSMIRNPITQMISLYAGITVYVCLSVLG